MDDQSYVRSIESLVLRQHEDQTNFQRTMDTMMSKLTQMMQIIEARDQEIVRLRENNNPRNEGVGNVEAVIPVRRPPLTEIAAQIPKFNFDDDATMSLEIWLRRIEGLKNAYELEDEVVKMLATNKFGESIKRWYDAQENLWTLTWDELSAKLKEMFGEVKDTAKSMDKMRSRRWKKGERLEDYFIDKLTLARKAELSDEETIPHIIRGIENFTIRCQIAAGQHENIENLFKAVKSISIALIDDTEYNRKFEGRREFLEGRQNFQSRYTTNSTRYDDRHVAMPSNNRTFVCFRCNQAGHIARICTTPLNEAKQTNTESSEVSVMFVETLAVPRSSATYYKKVETRNIILNALLDTGCPINLIRDDHTLFADIETSCSESRVLRGFGNRTVHCETMVVFKAVIDKKNYLIPATVVPKEVMNNDLVL